MATQATPHEVRDGRGDGSEQGGGHSQPGAPRHACRFIGRRQTAPGITHKNSLLPPAT